MPETQRIRSGAALLVEEAHGLLAGDSSGAARVARWKLEEALKLMDAEGSH